MNNLNNNFNNYSFQNQPFQQYFIQPQGVVYFINNSNELNNINMNSNVIVGICLPEETCYVKTIQNGSQNVSVYKFVNQNNQNNNESNISMILADFDKRLKTLENTNKKGGPLSELI